MAENKKRNRGIEERRAGELAACGFSEKAAKVYVACDPLNVYEYVTADGKRYAYDGVLGVSSGLTFEELEKTFEVFADEILTICS